MGKKKEKLKNKKATSVSYSNCQVQS